MVLVLGEVCWRIDPCVGRYYALAFWGARRTATLFSRWYVMTNEELGSAKHPWRDEGLGTTKTMTLQ